MKRILLTGASGVLGAVVAEELSTRSELTCLTRRRRLEVAGATEVAGDLTAPGMGLDARRLQDLIAATDVIVHCGALTSFGKDPETARRVNVEGTHRILDLANRAGARLIHVSTAFVARVDEFSGAQPSNLRSPVSYLRSKVEGESLVLSSGLDPVVVRPSVLMGDSRTGCIQQFQGWHTMCEAVIFGRTPFLPAGQDAIVDCVPVDFAARAVARLALGPMEPGEWWLTAGEDAFTLQRSVDLCMEMAAEHGLSPHRPRMLPLEMMERLVMPAFVEGAPPALRRQMLEGIELMRLFGSEDRFPSRWPAELGAPPAGPDDLQRCFEMSMRYLCGQRGLDALGRVA